MKTISDVWNEIISANRNIDYKRIYSDSDDILARPMAKPMQYYLLKPPSRCYVPIAPSLIDMVMAEKIKKYQSGKAVRFDRKD